MLTPQTPQVRKLLLRLASHKERYRKLRDVYALGQYMRDVRSACVGRHPPPYDVLIALIGHLKACADVAQQRTYNWQRFCFKDEFVLRFLVEAVCLLGDDFN